MREVHWILGGLLAAVAIASLIGYLLHRRSPLDPSIANLNARIRSWWIMILIGCGALLLGRAAILILFAALSALSLRELLATVKAGRVARMLSFLLVLPVQYLFVGFEQYIPFLFWVPLCCVRLLVKRTSMTEWGLLLCVYGISHVPALAMLHLPGYANRIALLMVFLVLVAQVSDILQYVWGKLIGRHLLLPNLSPSKTVEGLVGGVLSVTVFGAFLSPMTPFAAWQAALMAFTIAVFGFIGGVAMSAIKRRHGVKDWSQLIAGHGGMLDRLDSLCLSAPVFFYLTRYFFGEN